MRVHMSKTVGSSGSKDSCSPTIHFFSQTPGHYHRRRDDRDIVGRKDSTSTSDRQLSRTLRSTDNMEDSRNRWSCKEERVSDSFFREHCFPTHPSNKWEAIREGEPRILLQSKEEQWSSIRTCMEYRSDVLLSPQDRKTHTFRTMMTTAVNKTHDHRTYRPPNT